VSRPERIRLSRRKGWRLPDGAVNVARPSKWGNPFVVGQDGTRAQCVEFYALLAGGYLCLTAKAEIEPQRRVMAMMKSQLHQIRGATLACWCSLDGPCHGDVLLALANEPRAVGMLDQFVMSRAA
jgi:hypothetical protein